jgi:dual-specificity kinase
MSTPSTATATLPPHQQYYPHHQHTYPQPVANYHVNGQQLVNGSSRLGNSLQQHGYSASNASPEVRKSTTSTARAPQLPPLSASVSSPDMSLSRKRDRKPDWEEFYKNGVPKEVIVIDDDSPPPVHARSGRNDLINGAAASEATGRHADKKRKTATSNGYDPVYQNPPASYSTTQTPYYDHSSSKNTISTDRTTSAINTTAATSLGSQASVGGYNHSADNGVVGQKRKRTRKSAADEANEAKRREIEARENPLKYYVPPPNPPIKARDVQVPVIPDVRLSVPQASR